MRSVQRAALVGLAGMAGGGLIWQAVQLRQCRSQNEHWRETTGQSRDSEGATGRLEKQESDAAELARLRESEAALRQQVVELRGRLGSLLRAEAEREARGSDSEMEEPASTPPDRGEETKAGTASDGEAARSISNAISGAIDFGVEAEIVKARTRLSLTGEQEERIRGLVGQAMKEGGENLRKVLAGEVSVDEVPTAEEWGLDLEQKVLSVLSSDQQANYWYYKHQDAMAKARLMANDELLEVQDTLGLTEDQQDQMFTVLYDQALSRLDPDPEQMGLRPQDPLDAAEWEYHQRVADLQGVLTAEQIEIYRRGQEGRLALFRGIRSLIGKNRAGQAP